MPELWAQGRSCSRLALSGAADTGGPDFHLRGALLDVTGERVGLFGRVGFIVTNLSLPSRAGSTAIAVANSGANAVKIGTRRSSLCRHLI
jgi:hypothetical protein